MTLNAKNNYEDGVGGHTKLARGPDAALEPPVEHPGLGLGPYRELYMLGRKLGQSETTQICSY